MSDTSEKQTEANRRNGKRGGVKTEEGKAVVKYNALKHGILSESVLIDKGSGMEDPDEFRALQSYVVQELKPVGAIEEMLADRIITGYWRLRRAIIAEVGSIRKNTDTLPWQRFIRRYKEADNNRDFLSITYTERTTSKIGVEEMLKVLDELELSVKESDLLTDKELEQATEYFHHRTVDGYSLDYWLRFFTLASRDNPKDQKGEPAIPKPNAKKGMLGVIKHERARLTLLLEGAEEVEKLEDEHSMMVRSLPNKEYTDKILRYETTIERSIYRALHELQRLQAARINGNAPLPISVDVDVSKEG
jgi:hypothetical protein